MSPSDLSFWDAVDRVRARDPRYRREAYGFVVAALGAAVQALPAERRSHPVRRHLSGQELTSSVIRLARAEFGMLAATVFREWGVTTREDIGRIVFELVELGQLSARPEDSLDDFRGGGDLLLALRSGLELGTGRRARRPSPTRPLAGGTPESGA